MPIPAFVWVASIALQGIGMGISAYAASKKDEDIQGELAKRQFNERRARANRRQQRQEKDPTARHAGVRNIVGSLANRSSSRARRDRRSAVVQGAQDRAEGELRSAEVTQTEHRDANRTSSNTIKDRLVARGGVN